MNAVAVCESCGMPLSTPEDHALGDQSIPYCTHCTTETGALQSFEERVERMTRWAMRTDGLDRPTAYARTLDHLRGMPAWRDHPNLAQG